jgi:hypothetical protein
MHIAHDRSLAAQGMAAMTVHGAAAADAPFDAPLRRVRTRLAPAAVEHAGLAAAARSARPQPGEERSPGARARITDVRVVTVPSLPATILRVPHRLRRSKEEHRHG